MAKQPQRLENKLEKSTDAIPPSSPAGRKNRPSMALLVAVVGVLVAGILLGSTRELRIESAAQNALADCGATTEPETDGLSDNYGIVRFQSHIAEIDSYLSLCETNPKLALRIFREALGGKLGVSGELVALQSAFYLTSHKQLESNDFQVILGLMETEGTVAEMRKVAQRVVSDLTVIEDVEHARSYEIIPAGLPPPVTDPKDKDSHPKPHKVQTKEEKLTASGKAVVLVRWSSPDVAAKWWETMATQGHWDAELQRFVIPPTGKETQ